MPVGDGLVLKEGSEVEVGLEEAFLDNLLLVHTVLT